VTVERFPVRDAVPQAHDWTLYEHISGLVECLDAAASLAHGGPTGARDAHEAIARADAIDCARMDSDRG
jgi:hypothetical protein